MLNEKEKTKNKCCLFGRFARRRETVASNRTWQHNLGFAKLHLNKPQDFQNYILWGETTKVEIGRDTSLCGANQKPNIDTTSNQLSSTEV